MNKIKNFFAPLSGYQRRVMFIFIGGVIGVLSVVYSMFIVRKLAQKEINEIKLWSHAMMTMASTTATQSAFESSQNMQFNKLLLEIINNNSIPSVITDNHLRIVKYTNSAINEEDVNNSKEVQKLLEKLSSINNPMEVEVFGKGTYYIFYGESPMLSMLRLIPFLQLGIVVCFGLVVFISFRSSKQDEQKRVWIGMAKETAHQLGTPTSSLLGWLEYLKSQNVEGFVIEEMNKDITRLLKVVDRFSKIGSQTILTPKNINNIVGTAVTYFTTRIPKNVELRYKQIDSSPLQALVNEALFEWVIENLLKNALDALQGKGFIEVVAYQDAKWIYVDVIDSGKGISKSNFNDVFSPGYTTKTRGWGLGLSLSNRIIEEYHNGRILVASSEIGKGTTMRVMLKKL